MISTFPKLASPASVKFNGKHHSTIEIQVVSVMEEGAGAILSNRAQIDAEGQNILIDFGSGTTILSLFGAKGKLIDRRVYPAGVERLIDAIATNEATRTHLAQAGDRAVAHFHNFGTQFSLNFGR